MTLAPAALAKIRELDPSARVLWSVYTRGHYVSARIEDGSEPGILSGFCEHRSTPGEAVLAYWGRVIKSPRLVVGAYTESRREVFWDAAHGRWENYGTEVDTTDMLEVSPSARAMGRDTSCWCNCGDCLDADSAGALERENAELMTALRTARQEIATLEAENALRADQIRRFVAWLYENQPDVWQRGLWEEHNAAIDAAREAKP